jgi:putative transcriptional regulator
VKGGAVLDKKRIAERLINLRGQKSRDEVARALNISISALQMYENGYRIPKDEIKIKIAKYFGISVESIFFAE